MILITLVWLIKLKKAVDIVFFMFFRGKRGGLQFQVALFVLAILAFFVFASILEASPKVFSSFKQKYFPADDCVSPYAFALSYDAASTVLDRRNILGEWEACYPNLAIFEDVAAYIRQDRNSHPPTYISSLSRTLIARESRDITREVDDLIGQGRELEALDLLKEAPSNVQRDLLARVHINFLYRRWYEIVSRQGQGSTGADIAEMSSKLLTFQNPPSVFEVAQPLADQLQKFRTFQVGLRYYADALLTSSPGILEESLRSFSLLSSEDEAVEPFSSEVGYFSTRIGHLKGSNSVDSNLAGYLSVMASPAPPMAFLNSNIVNPILRRQVRTEKEKIIIKAYLSYAEIQALAENRPDLALHHLQAAQHRINVFSEDHDFGFSPYLSDQVLRKRFDYLPANLVEVRRHYQYLITSEDVSASNIASATHYHALALVRLGELDLAMQDYLNFLRSAGSSSLDYRLAEEFFSLVHASSSTVASRVSFFEVAASSEVQNRDVRAVASYYHGLSLSTALLAEAFLSSEDIYVTFAPAVDAYRLSVQLANDVEEGLINRAYLEIFNILRIDSAAALRAFPSFTLMSPASHKQRLALFYHAHSLLLTQSTVEDGLSVLRSILEQGDRDLAFRLATELYTEHNPVNSGGGG